MAYSTINIDDLEAVWGVVRFARHELGVEAFGVNWFELPAHGDGKEHDERDSQQEEVNIVIEGSGVWRVDSEDVPVRRGTFMRFDPDAVRQPVAGPDGMTFIAIGARRGSYEPRGPF